MNFCHVFIKEKNNEKEDENQKLTRKLLKKQGISCLDTTKISLHGTCSSCGNDFRLPLQAIPGMPNHFQPLSLCGECAGLTNPHYLERLQKQGILLKRLEKKDIEGKKRL